MFSFRDILLKLSRCEDLTRDEAASAFTHIMSGQAADAQIGGLLVGLAAKGTTVDELVGAATVMREKVIPIDAAGIGVVLDTCGTGGDIRHTFNISTATALIAAGAGIKVVKHGNRSASSNCGAADVLEKLGVKLENSPGNLRRCLDRANICFAFARAHHPAMKYVADARKALGIPTIFNLLGPLTNPGRAKHQLLGVFAPELTDRLAAVLRELGSTRAWVVHAEDGLDEISTIGPTRISELLDGHIRTFKFDPSELGIEYARLSDLQISTLDEAAGALTSVLHGDSGPKRDIALLNAAAAMVVAEGAKDLQSALEIARKSLDEGKAAKALELLIAESNRG
jgi:anthranilate phosphoribosyltransferase